ncbi:MAG: exo-alpha-sialidase, partial [Methanomassiliicoccales archaeon]
SDILYINSTDNGSNWNIEKEINDTMGNDNSCDFPDIAVADNDIFVVYRDKGPGGIKQIFFSQSHDNGINWERGVTLSNSTSSIVGSVVNPAITAEGDNVCIVWEDFRNATDGGIELFLKSSSDRGITWSEDIRLTYAPGDSLQPDILINKSAVHIVWSDYRDGNMEIYYKQLVLPRSLISSVVDIKPDTLNLKSKGRWITAYIELSGGYSVSNINFSTILLEDMMPIEHHPIEIGDYDNDGFTDQMVKFDRSELEDYLNNSIGFVNLTIRGELRTGESFEGGETIRTILP